MERHVIYYVYFSALREIRPANCWDSHGIHEAYKGRPNINTFSILGKLIRESENDSFVFILTGVEKPSMLDRFNAWLQKEGLEDLVIASPQGFTNRNYPETQRNLHLRVIMSPIHWYRDLMPLEDE